ncbi:hypothetical protein HDU90_008967 [Geranomyces variabilis]|nr:hypothetical protein HDU90_008967 [Geranomyces variabilis]
MPPKRADKLRLKEEKAEKARIAQAKHHAREQQAAATAQALLLLEQEAAEREAAAVKARETTRQEIKDLVAHFSQSPSKKGRIRQVAPALCRKSVRAELQAAENSSEEPATGMLDAEYAQVAAQCLRKKMEAALHVDASHVPTKLNEPPDNNGIDAFHLYAASGLGHISLDPAAEYDAIRDEHMRRRIADREIERKDGRKGSLTYEAFGLLNNRDPVGSEKVKGNDNLRLHDLRVH